MEFVHLLGGLEIPKLFKEGLGSIELLRIQEM